MNTKQEFLRKNMKRHVVFTTLVKKHRDEKNEETLFDRIVDGHDISRSATVHEKRLMHCHTAHVAVHQ